MPLVERMERFTDKSGGPHSCWLWMGGRVSKTNPLRSYGVLAIERKATTAHRVTYELAYGPIPAKMIVCHHCDNPPCVNPAHLYLGTPAINTADMLRKGRWRLPSRDHPVRGEAVKGAKLTAAQVLAMRDLRRSGASYAELMEQFEMSWSSVEKICTGRLWKHLL